MHTIFVADDDELDAQLTRRAIGSAIPDANIFAYADGEQTLEALRKATNAPHKPDLVLLDFKMPKLNCLDIVKQLEHEFMNKVPLVVFSSSVGPTDISKCLNEGIREYVEKPTDPDLYSEAVMDICRRFVSVM